MDKEWVTLVFEIHMVLGELGISFGHDIHELIAVYRLWQRAEYVHGNKHVWAIRGKLFKCRVGVLLARLRPH